MKMLMPGALALENVARLIRPRDLAAEAKA